MVVAAADAGGVTVQHKTVVPGRGPHPETERVVGADILGGGSWRQRGLHAGHACGRIGCVAIEAHRIGTRSAGVGVGWVGINRGRVAGGIDRQGACRAGWDPSRRPVASPQIDCVTIGKIYQSGRNGGAARSAGQAGRRQIAAAARWVAFDGLPYISHLRVAVVLGKALINGPDGDAGHSLGAKGPGHFAAIALGHIHIVGRAVVGPGFFVLGNAKGPAHAVFQNSQ